MTAHRKPRRWQVIQGDCVEAMRLMDENSVDAIVTDPPYGLEFMGKEWDKLHGTVLDDPSVVGGFQDGAGGNAFSRSRIRYGNSKPEEMQAWHYMWAVEALRVLKPGGHLLAFGGTRTYHRLASAVEDAGFEIRDQLQWLYGTGFPKSHNVSKAIDKAAGAEREKVPATGGLTSNVNLNDDGWSKIGTENPTMDSNEPMTPEAQQWDGWGTALKPAHEPIVLARKPFKGTVAGNVLEHGTGALNVGGTRISMGDEYDSDKVQRQRAPDTGVVDGAFGASSLVGKEIQTYKPGGRWPANIILDEAAGRMLDEQSDNASRFFYSPKASKAEREAGLPIREDGKRSNHHATVKPVSLMEYLIRLIAPPDGLVLDPFSGSGSTGIAATNEGFRYLGIEMDESYVDISRARIRHAIKERREGK